MFNIAVLALLLLLSPCKVRNSVQSFLDVPQTEVSNYSVTTLSQSGCSVADVSIDAVTQEVKTSKQKVFLADALAIFAPANIGTNYKELSLPLSTQIEDLKTQVPFYILFQRFKYHL